MSGPIEAPTQFIEGGKARYAYRRFGTPADVPIVLLQHFTGGLDHWDPGFTEPLAAGREVILVDNAGVGRSSGTAPDTIEEMADFIFDFVEALGLSQFDLLGFSMGGMVAQAFAKKHSDRLRKLILIGTSPRGGDVSPQIAEVSERARGGGGPDDMAWLFFGHSENGKAAAARYWERRHRRTEDLDPALAPETMMAQVTAGRDWLTPHGDRFADLAAITNPTLVINGSNDVMLPTINSFYLQQNLPNATLILYPDAGHAAHFQYPEAAVAQINLFLDG